MTEKISVIVPVYNVEKYLRQCLDSILSQTYQNLEILIINDGSTDGSDAICREYLKKDERISYHIKENSGISDTRNVGLQLTSGEYVTFVDSDDWIEKNYVEELYNKLITYNADIAIANYYLYNDAESLFYFFMGEQDYYERLYTPVQLIDGLYEKKFNKSLALISAWGKLYKRSLFDELLFPKGRIGEDGFFNLKAFLICERVVYLNKGLYAYRERSGSLSRTWTDDWMSALVYAMEERLALLASRGYPLEKHINVYRTMLKSCLENGRLHGLESSETYRQIKEKNHVLSYVPKSQTEPQHAIVLAANYPYVDQVLATIKSVLYHHRNIRFYLINGDFPQEWFTGINRHLQRLDSEIINCRVSMEQIQQYKTEISYTVFLRYFVPDFVKEDRVIYMDCDMVVTGPLDELFSLDLEGHPIAAVRDHGGRVFYNREIFNAGFLVIDNAYWKAKQMSQYLIEMTNKWHDKVDQADQSILNMVFENNWLELPFDFNHVVLHSHFTSYQIPNGQSYPKVIHYLSHRKPWFPLAAQTYRDVWWFYAQLDWSEVSENIGLEPLRETMLYPEGRPFTCLIYTSMAEIPHLEDFIRALPQVNFKIAARVHVADSLARLIRYSNVTVYSGISELHGLDDELVMTSNVLLDINPGEKTIEILDRFNRDHKPILAFQDLKSTEHGQRLFARENWQELARSIDKIRKGED